MSAKHICIASVTALLAGFVRPASAAEYVVKSDGADAILYNGNGPADMAAGDLDAGRRFTTQSRIPLFSFPLPTLGDNEVVTNAVLKVYYVSKSNSPVWNVDLYAIRVAAAAGILSSDWGYGATPTVGTLLQDNYITPESAGGRYVNTSTEGNAALLAYLGSNYVSGRYLIVRLNPDVDAGSEGGNEVYFRFGAREWGGGVRAATLTLTTGPKFSKATVIQLN